MRYLIITLTFISLLGCATSNGVSNEKLSDTTAEQQPAKDNDTVASEDNSSERLVCRMEKEIGSNKRVRTCKKVSGT